MLLIALVGTALVVAVAVRPLATARVLTQIVLFSVAGMAVLMMQAVGPEPALVGAAISAAVLWLLILVSRPRARRLAV